MQIFLKICSCLWNCWKRLRISKKFDAFYDAVTFEHWLKRMTIINWKKKRKKKRGHQTTGRTDKLFIFISLPFSAVSLIKAFCNVRMVACLPEHFHICGNYCFFPVPKVGPLTGLTFPLLLIPSKTNNNALLSIFFFLTYYYVLILYFVISMYYCTCCLQIS